MYQKPAVRFGGPMTPQVKRLIIIMAVIFFIHQFFSLFGLDRWFSSLFGLSHATLVYQFRIWQLFTYMFVHGGFTHILFNCLALWMFGSDLERLWGSKKFLRYFLFSGVGAGFVIAVVNAVVAFKFGNAVTITYGSSGAVFALLLAYGVTWPNREMMLWFILPIKMKYFVLGYGLISFFGTAGTVAGQAGTISHAGHLGGLVVGFILLRLGVHAPKEERSQFSGVVPKRGNFLEERLKRRRIEKKQGEIKNRIKAKEIIDTLLEKIGETGLESLTSEEKRDLEWARKNYYPSGSDVVH